MKKAVLLLVFGLFACGQPSSDSPHGLSREPVSVRGWIHDVAGAQPKQSPDLEIARRQSLFAATSVWVENSQYASGGVAENGSFIVLDVPPGNTTLGFNAPGAETAKVTLQDVPGTADVIIPDIVLRNGGATVRDPKAIRVRLPMRVDKPRATGRNAIVCGFPVPIVETPLAQMSDRRDYPDPGGFRPVAIVR